MKKSLACTVLAGLLAGCVMTGAEAAGLPYICNAVDTIGGYYDDGIWLNKNSGTANVITIISNLYVSHMENNGNAIVDAVSHLNDCRCVVSNVIRNNGGILVFGRKITTDAQGINNSEGASLHLNGPTNLQLNWSDNQIFNSEAVVDNAGTLVMEGESIITSSGYSGARFPAIRNKGKLEIRDISYMCGQIIHNSVQGAGTLTNLTVNGSSKYSYDSGIFIGTITGAKENEFQLNLNNAHWIPEHQFDEPIYGVTSHDSHIGIDYFISNGEWPVFNNKIRFVDFKETGTATLFSFNTSLRTGDGDHYIFEGTTPNTKFDVIIYDNNVNNENNVIAEDADGVPIITVPKNSGMYLGDSVLKFCNNKVVYPIIHLVEGEENKEWILVGWSEEEPIYDPGTSPGGEEPSPVVTTFTKFIQGELEGVPDTLSLTENMVDGPNGGTADSGLASQTNSELHINLNGHTLGTEGNEFTVKVASGKTVYLSGGTGGVSRVYTSWTLGDVGTGYANLNTSGGLSISGDIDGVGMLNNDGTVTIGGNVNGSLLLTNSGSLVLDGRKINVGQITNTGELIINSNKTPGTYYINGDVYHTGATRTEINLVGTNNNEGRAALAGRVYGSDENFEMTLRQAEWQMDNVVDRSTVDFGTIHNVSLEKGGSISTNLNTMYYVDNLGSYTSAVAWRDVYGTATFHNLKNDGTGRIDLAVDLANSVGDQIILQGETPAKLGVMLFNKDNNGDMEFVPDGEHKVTYAKAPLGSSVEIDTELTPMYGKQSMIYTPIVEETTNDMREWNFVGWTQRPREDGKLNAKDELDIPDLLPEMEEKRLEEIHRYAVHKDLSELGAWVRGETGKMSADGVDFDVKVISGGYDWANKTSKGNFFMGLGVSHGTSDADMGFVGDSKNTSFSVYGSWYGRKNYDYIDFVAKYGKIDHQYNGINFENVPCSGEYDKNMYSFFAKYGRRLPLKKGFYIEPFGSVTYGHIGDADFYDNGQGAHMHVNSILSKIVSVGAMFGRSVKGTELYCKLAYSYDFDGEIRGSVAEQNYSEKTDMGGSSYKFAVGASRNLGKQNSLHLDLEKDFGGKMKRPWNLALTFKHTW